MKYLCVTLISLFIFKTCVAQSSWSLSNSGIEAGFDVTDFNVTASGEIFAVGEKVLTSSPYFVPGIYKSTDNGNNWIEISTTGLENYNYVYNSICSSGSTLLISASNNTEGYAVLKSTDDGVTWVTSNTGFDASFNVTDMNVTSGGEIFAVGEKILTTSPYFIPAVYKSTDNGSSWNIINTSGIESYNYVYNAICPSGNNLFISATNNTEGYAILKSTDGGVTWAVSNSGIDAAFSVTDIAVANGGELIAVGEKILTAAPYFTPGIYQSTDNGASWTLISTTGIENYNYVYNSICAAGNSLLISAADNMEHYAVLNSSLPAGINDILFYNTVPVFPNPATNRLTIDLPNTKIDAIEIYDMQGKQLIKTGAATSIDVSGLASGAYFISVSGGNKVWRRIFVKE